MAIGLVQLDMCGLSLIMRLAEMDEPEVYRWSGLNDCFFRLTRAAATVERQSSSPVRKPGLLSLLVLSHVVFDRNGMSNGLL